MKKYISVVILCIVSLFICSIAEAIVHVEGRYWFTNLSSNVQVTDASIIGTDINLVDTLGIDNNKNFWEARVDFNLLDHHLRYAYMPMSWKGQKNITQTVDFAGQSYTGGASVDSSLEIIYQRLGYRYNIIDTLGNQLGVIFDIKLLSIDASLKAPTISIDKSYSVTVPLPTIGLGAQVGLPFLFSVGVEATGIGYSGNHLVDGEAHINFNPIPFTTVSGGYRIFDMKVKDGDNKVDFTLKGPFLMVKVGF